jgi:rhodanese-related sulfurtransferase
MGKMRGLGLLLTMLLAPALVAGCAALQDAETRTPTRNSQGYAALSPEDLATMLATEDPLLVNVHIPYEGEIEGTDIHIPYNTIDRHLDKLLAHDAPIVVYCMSGPMSRDAAQRLSELGYVSVYELTGGMRAWEAAGFELIYRP